MSALYHRDRVSGEGQVIDLPLFEAAFRASEDALLDYSVSGKVRQRSGNRSGHVVPASNFKTSDGDHIALHAGTDSLFRKLALAIGRPDLSEDLRFNTIGARVKYQGELYPIIEEWVASKSTAKVMAILNDAGIPASPIMSIADIADDPHYQGRGTYRRYHDVDYGDLLMATPVPRMSQTPGRVQWLGPSLGAHNDEVFRGLLGMADEECEEVTGIRASSGGCDVING